MVEEMLIHVHSFIHLLGLIEINCICQGHCLISRQEHLCTMSKGESDECDKCIRRCCK